MARRQLSRLPVVVGMLVCVMPCELAAAAPTAPTAPTSAHPAAATSFASDPSANLVAVQASEGLDSQLSKLEAYAGLRIVPTGLEVFEVPTLPGADSLVRIAHAAQVAASPAATSPLNVTVTAVQRSASRLADVTRQLDADAPDWQQAGVPLSSWGPDIETNTVQVHLVHYSSDAAAQLRARYGANVAVDPTDMAPTASGRTNDTSPWYGGDAISVAGAGCTSWFTLLGSGQPNSHYEVTAGHCGTGTVKVGANTQGTITSGNRHIGGALDSSLYAVANDLPYIWEDPTSTNVRHVQAVASSDPIGALICTGGATDREVCNVRVERTNQSVNYGYGNIGGLVYADQLNGRNAFSAGDSGGPVYSAVSTTACVAYGELVARINSTPSNGWYIPARTVTSSLGVVIAI